MAKGNNQKKSNDSGLNFEAQLWAAAEQAVPASHLMMTEYNGARPEGDIRYGGNANRFHVLAT
jgi:hypothetical protein